MKKLLILFTLTMTVTIASAQKTNFGIAARGGAFTTLVSAKQEIKANDQENGIGLQGGVGVWVSYHVTPRSKVQLTLLQTGERQSSGEIPLVDNDGSPTLSLNVVDYNLAVSSAATYMYDISDSWALGAGVGGMYEYLSQANVSFESKGASNASREYEDEFDNNYRRKFRAYLPIEAQYKLTDRIICTGQIQMQLSSRLAASESSFREHDLGLWFGINYKIR